MTAKGRQGFASMNADLQREIASRGGKAQGKDSNPSNFFNQRDRARAAGRAGGKKSKRGPVERESSQAA